MISLKLKIGNPKIRKKFVKSIDKTDFYELK